jgi:hypothetical protein
MAPLLGMGLLICLLVVLGIGRIKWLVIPFRIEGLIKKIRTKKWKFRHSLRSASLPLVIFARMCEVSLMKNSRPS